MKKQQNNLDRKLRDLPTHQLSKSSQDKIHDNVRSVMMKQEKQEKRRDKVKKYTAGIVSVAVLVLFVMIGENFLTMNNTPNNSQVDIAADQDQDQESDNESKEPVDNNVEDKQPNQEQEAEDFTEKTAKELMSKYKQTFEEVYEATNQDGLITNFETKNDVKQHFAQVMSEDLAAWMTDSYIREEGGQLYFIAKDAPTWLVEDKAFSIKQINKEEYQIVQERNNEQLGHVEMVYQVKWQEGKWKVMNVESTQLEQQASIEEKARNILEALNDRDMERLATYVHPEKGLLFSPYVYVEEDAMTFPKNKVATLLDDRQQYLWGRYDGSGKPMELTPSSYLEEFVPAEQLLNPDEVLIDAFKQRGNTINNIKDSFNEPRVVEYYDAGTEGYAGMDWQSLNLVFEQDQNGTWKLVGLISDQWTI